MPDIVDMTNARIYGPDSEGVQHDIFAGEFSLEAQLIQVEIGSRNQRPTLAERRAAALANLRTGVNDQAGITRRKTEFSY